MPEFSVKKPLTIFCAAIAVLVLGIVAYTRMTPDLFPSMDFPYVIIMTTDPGASPETVEEVVTKPMERSMATLDHIKTVSSTSSDNYSLVMLEFEDDVNLDTIGVDIQQNISTLQAGWDDTVGTPYVLKINPSMIPVMVVAVSMEGMDVTDLSEFVDETLMSQLEGVTGVARVSASGSIEQELHVVINQEKLDKQNELIRQGINRQMDNAMAQLNDMQDQIFGAMDDIEFEGFTIPSVDEILAEDGDVAHALDSFDEQVDKLKKTSEQLSNMIVYLEDLRYAINKPIERPSNPNAGIHKEEIAQLQAQQAEVQAQLDALNQELQAFVGDAQGEEAIARTQEFMQAHPEYLTLSQEVVRIQAQIAALRLEEENLTPEQIQASIDKLNTTINSMILQANDALIQVTEELSQLQKQLDSLTETAEEVSDELTIENLRQTYQDFTDDMDQLAQDLMTFMQEYTQGVLTMSVAMNQIQSGLTSIEGSRDGALAQADLNNLLTVQMVSQILTAQNFSMPAGYVEQDGISYMVSVGDEFTTQEQLEHLLLFDLGLDGVAPIYVGDVADVFITDNADSTYARLGNADGLMLSFEKQSNYATAQVSESIMDRFRQLENEYEGLTFVSLMDQGDYIYLIVDSILQSLLYGMLFSVLVLFLFLKDLRPTFITLIAMPLSVLFAIVLMYFSGISLNMISLSGLSIAVGMLVDNSVVVIENIYRLRDKGANAIQAAVSGAKQVAGAIVASTLTTICVFLPIVFVDGLTRQLFTDLALTMSYALIASLIVALTLVPAMASGMLKKGGKPKKDIMEKVYGKYRFAGTWALDHKPAVFAASILVLALSAALCLNQGFSFMPDIDSNTISGTVSFPEETELSEVMETSDEIVSRINGIEEVDTVGAMLGSSSLMGGSSGGNSVSLYVTLPEGVSGKAVGNEILSLCAGLDCEISVSSSMMDTSMLTGSGTSVVLHSSNMEDLQTGAKQVAAMLADIEGTAEISDGLEDATKALHVNIDRNKAMEHGYTVAQVYMQLAGSMTQSANATSFYLDGAAIDVIVETPEETHVTVENLADQVFTQENALTGETTEFPLSDIATIEETISLSTISRENQQRYLQITTTTAEGYNVTKVAAAVKAGMETLPLPASVSWSMSGENETIMEAMTQLVLMLLLGLMLVYFVMVAQFQSLKSPFIVMFTIPLAFTGGFLGLLITGMEVSIVSMIGFVMLMGIIVNNGIVLVDYVNQLRLEGWDRREAIIEAGCTRIRPILMTSLTTILGLAVMAMGRDAGTALMQPMAVVCIGGLLYATLMTLFVVPCIYDLMNKKDLRKVNDEDLVILAD